jgi:putative tricarboxylic transport membrane protein
MKIHHRLGSVFWLLVAVYVAVSAYQLGLGDLHKPGPGSVFFIAALLLAIFSVIDLVATFVRESKEDTENRPIWSSLQWKKILLFIVFISTYIYFLNLLGFLVSTFLLMTVLFKIAESMKWWIAIFASLITTFISYIIFKVWLMVPFPSGFLGF